MKLSRWNNININKKPTFLDRRLFICDDNIWRYRILDDSVTEKSFTRGLTEPIRFIKIIS